LVYTPADPLAMSIAGRLQGPSAAHPFGTDQYGRDVLSRIMRGAVTSIAVGVIAVGLGATAGVAIGVLSGYAGGWLDETLMRRIPPGDSCSRTRRIFFPCTHRSPSFPAAPSPSPCSASTSWATGCATCSIRRPSERTG